MSSSNDQSRAAAFREGALNPYSAPKSIRTSQRSRTFLTFAILFGMVSAIAIAGTLMVTSVEKVPIVDDERIFIGREPADD